MPTFTHRQLEALWQQAGGSRASANVAAAIAQAESSGVSSRIYNTAYPNLPGYSKPGRGSSPEFSVGLWQINLYAHLQWTEIQMLDPLENARAAVSLSRAGADFTAWSTYVDGAYRSHLDVGPAPPPPRPPPKPPPASAKETNIPIGWTDLTDAFARKLPWQLVRTSRLNRAARARLRRAR